MRLQPANQRRGIILMVVLALLTLFAIVGITFVLYSDSEAAAARIAREAESQQRADVDPEQALAFFLGQLIYDVNDNDVTGVGSGLRGHSLARTMYGYNYATLGVPGTNIVPFNGVGRLHYPSQLGQNDYNLVNYTWFSGDKFLRDPERYGTRSSPLAAQGNPYIGANAPYTYPDLNSFFLAAVDSNGNLLTPSYHRKWLFNPNHPLNDMNPGDNPNWWNAQGKYLTLRPRPAEHPQFPIPDDPTGDVKNLVGAPGGNDSIWIDIGAPVMTAPDGTQYKMLVAPLIMDLDNRINLGTAGNILGNGPSSRSNQGWFSSEVNLSYLWSNSANAAVKAEWLSAFQGNATNYGKYGPNKVPNGQLFPTGSAAHVYGQADLDGRNELAGGTPTGAITLPTTPGPANQNPCFPNFPPGYGSGSGSERANHPAGYSPFKSWLYTAGNDDLVFRPSDMEALLRPNSLGQHPVDSGSSALLSSLQRLFPNSLFGTGANVPLRRNSITTISADLVKPGVSPWVYNPLTSAYVVNPAQPSLPPFGGPIPFPSLTQRNAALPGGSDFTTNWRGADAIGAPYGRIDLNRPLPPFPHMSSGTTAAIVVPNGRYDTNPAALTQFQTAMQARQIFANDIYRRLLAVTGVSPSGTPANPSAADLAPRRWLAQLAVNIVDYIDADEISTPFNFYTAADAGNPTFNIYQVTPTTTTIPPYPKGNPDVPAYWVFGTELPRVVINEVLGEYTVTTDIPIPPILPTAVTGPLTVKLWVELFNPLPAPATVAGTQAANKSVLQPQDGLPVPLYVPAAGGGTLPYNPYQIVIANNNIAPNAHGLWYNAGGTNNNVLGTPQHIRATCNLSAGNGTVGTVPPPPPPTYSIAAPAGGLPGQSFMLVGPPGNDANNDITSPGVPKGTPWLQSPNMQYTATYRAKLKQWQIAGVPILDELNGVSVLLRRLANPHLPPNPYTPAGALVNPALPPNPFITVDYAHGVQLNGYGLPPGKPPVPVNKLKVPIPGNGPVPPGSYGKRQPYAANFNPNPLFSQYTTQPTPQGAVNHHTLGSPNVPLDNPFTWLVHLDRKLISPMELLHVSGFYPHELTQRFILVPNGNNPVIPQPYSYAPVGKQPVGSLFFQHYVPWFDQTRRLYRLFEFLDTHDGTSGISPLYGRVPGKININTLWDLPAASPVCLALADPSPTPDNPNFTTGNVISQFTALLTSRTPGLAGKTLNTTDRPFVGMAPGVVAAGDTQYPNGMGINHTLLTGGAAAAPTGQRLLQLPLNNPTNPPTIQTTHPYLQNQLLTKVYGRLTTRSNVFAVFVTVGFFQVVGTVQGQPNIPQLGPEIGRSEGRQVRHRMFAIVDRTQLAAFSTMSSTSVAAPPSAWQPTTAKIALAAAGPIAVGSQIVVEPGTANEETVVVTAVAGTNVTANFLKQHPNPLATGTPVGSTYSVILRGNPGPWQQKPYDPRQDPLVVPYYSIID